MSDPCVVGTFDRMSSAEEVVRKLQGGGFPVPNVSRNQIGTYDDLKKDKDGSVTLYIQNASPGKDKESNWLPAPKGAFNLAM